MPVFDHTIGWQDLRYVDMLSDNDTVTINEGVVKSAAEKATEDYIEPINGARLRLKKVLQVMAYAHYASLCRGTAEKMLIGLE